MNESLKPVELSVLQQQFGDDRGLIDAILEEFAISTTGYTTELRAALDLQEMKRLQDIAHKIKSAAFTIGAEKLGNTCSALENEAKSEDEVLALQYGEEVLGQLGEVKSYIKQQILA